MWRVQRSLWIPSQWRQMLCIDTFHFDLRPACSISQQMQQRSPGICLTHQILVFGCWVCLTWRSEFPQKSSTNVSVTSFHLPSPTSFWGHSSRAFSLNSLGLFVFAVSVVGRFALISGKKLWKGYCVWTVLEELLARVCPKKRFLLKANSSQTPTQLLPSWINALRFNDVPE